MTQSPCFFETLHILFQIFFSACFKTSNKKTACKFHFTVTSFQKYYLTFLIKFSEQVIVVVFLFTSEETNSENEKNPPKVTLVHKQEFEGFSTLQNLPSPTYLLNQYAHPLSTVPALFLGDQIVVVFLNTNLTGEKARPDFPPSRS